jgi:hypothetical protein
MNALTSLGKNEEKSESRSLSHLSASSIHYLISWTVRRMRQKGVPAWRANRRIEHRYRDRVQIHGATSHQLCLKMESISLPHSNPACLASQLIPSHWTKYQSSGRDVSSIARW